MVSDERTAAIDSSSRKKGGFWHFSTNEERIAYYFYTPGCQTPFNLCYDRQICESKKKEKITELGNGRKKYK